MIHLIGTNIRSGLLRFQYGTRVFSSTGILSTSSNFCREWVEKMAVNDLPLKYFVMRFDKSSGPGGQNVNKVNTKCTLTLHNFSNCSLFPEDVRLQMMEKNSRFYSKNSDNLVIQSDETRSREQNKQLCLEKLVNNIKETCYFAGDTDPKDIRKWEKIRNISKENRLKNKKQNSEKKKSRRLF